MTVHNELRDEPMARKVDGRMQLDACVTREAVVRVGRSFGDGPLTRTITRIEEHDDRNVGYHTHVHFKWPGGQRGMCTGGAFLDYLDGLVKGRTEEEQARWLDCGEGE